jgi:FAD/FMN-containing dehydrogenase
MTAVHSKLIIQALTAADIRVAVLQARERGLRVAVRATGHGTFTEPDGALLIDTSAMTSVLVDPDRLTARADRRSGLFWALRGAGGSFGVVTALEFKLHHVPEVYGGSVRFRRALAGAVLSRFREYANELPEELNVSVVITPDAVALRGVHAGGADEALRALAPLLVAEPAHDTFRPMPYSGTVTIGGTRPRAFELLRDIPVDAVLATAETAGAVEVKLWGGAIARGEGPAGHRDVPFSVTVDGDDVAALEPHVHGGAFLNFVQDAARTRDGYTAADYARLAELKRAYDPDNVFGTGHNIAPADAMVELAA